MPPKPRPTRVLLIRYRSLRAEGVPRRRLAELIARGALLRIRKGTYLRGDAPGVAVDAARQGGRLDCVSLLALLGVFVLEAAGLHVQMDHGSTRVSPSPGVVRHWRPCLAGADDVFVDIVHAVAQACRCQPIRAAVATIDSAWHLGLIGESDLAEIFALLPARYASLRGLLDPRAESGPETLLRLLLRAHGWAFEVQVDIAGVGRVDFLIDGWLIIECDSAAHHSSWQERRRDLRRDLAAAALGYTTLRPIAEDIMWHADVVIEGIRGLLRARQQTARAQRRHFSPNRAQKPR